MVQNVTLARGTFVSASIYKNVYHGALGRLQVMGLEPLGVTLSSGLWSPISKMAYIEQV